MDDLGPIFGIYSSGPTDPWLWIIEYLSSFPQIDISIIRGLIQTAPVLPEDLGENTSEMVALRCLEELFCPKNGLGNVAPPDSRVAFDLSLSCVDVLERILQEVPLSNLKTAGPELLKWDVQPFIMHKRASLPKCALEKLKGSMSGEIPVDGDENVPTLKFDDSDVPVVDGDENVRTSRFNNGDDENDNQEGNLIPQTNENYKEVLQELLEKWLKGSILGEIPVVDGDENVPTSKFNDSDVAVVDGDENVCASRFNDGDDENDNQEGNLISQTTENDYEVLQDELLERNLLPSKRCRNQDNMDNNLCLNAKKFKQDATCTIQSVEQILNRLHGEGQVEDDPGIVMKVTEIEGNNLGKDSQAGEVDQDVNVASRTHGQSNAVSHLELQDSQMENVQNADADVMVQKKYGDGPFQNVVIDESNYVENGALQKSLSGDAGENSDQDFPLISPNSTSADGLQDSRMENVQKADADVMVQQKYGDRPCQNVVIDESNHVENAALQKGLCGDAGKSSDQGFPLSSPNSASADGLQQNTDPNKAKVDMERPCAGQICENEDEMLNIALEKSLFLSSQGRPPSQDPEGKAVGTGHSLCVKCNRNGEVLVCSSTGCPLVVHESCLSSAARFDEKGNFCCPFCAYSRSMSKYLEGKERVSLARKDLDAFMELYSKIMEAHERRKWATTRAADKP